MRMLFKGLFLLASGAGILSSAACSKGDRTGAPAASPEIVLLDASDQPLRDNFNRDRGDVRLLFLVDPRCPECLKGLADIGEDLLSTLPQGARVRTYVVYEPVIGGRKEDIPAAARLLKTDLARHYWNPSGDFGRKMSHALGYWNGTRWVYAWDTWLIYPADATWNGATPPKPAFLMHQLGGLKGNPKFPHLDSKVFAAKVNGMLARLNRSSAP